MSLITQEIKNMKGGISQQPDILRYPDQAEEQVNGFSSEVEGLQKRPPTVHIKRLWASLPGNPLVKLINRDEFERYYVVFNGGTPRVWDLEGMEYTVANTSADSYLTTSNHREDLRLVTVADYTFIINRKVPVKMKSALTLPGFRKDGQCLINVKGGQYGRTYKVTINGTVAATFTTPKGTTSEDADKIDTQYITGQLHTQMVASLTGWTVTKGPNWVQAVAPAGTVVATLVTEDGFNNGLMTGVVFEAQRFNVLPAQAPAGYLVKVTGDPGSGADDYYIRFDAEKLVWIETVAPGVTYELDATTMPHALVRLSNGSFEFRALDWQDRPSGDLDSSPDPSFVDATINDVFFWRNRLGLLAGENIILSASGRFFEFFPKSVVALADTDPIDVAVSHTRVSVLNHAVPFAEELLLWSDQTQFVMRAEGALSVKSIKVDQSTEFESAIHARPVAAGRGVYFAAPRATFTSVRRYYAVQDVSAVKSAEDISSHVPSYIPNGVYALGSSSTENIVTVSTQGAPHKVYLYKYLYQNDQLAQQSWSHWDFGVGNQVLACELVGAIMYLLINRPEGLFLESLEFTQNTKDLPQEPYRLHIDRKANAMASAYNPDTNFTTVSLAGVYGAVPVSGTFWVVASTGRAFEFPMPVGGWGDGVVLVPGDFTGIPLVVGTAYEFRYQFSKFLIKVEDRQGGMKSETTGRLQLRRGWVNYNNSGPFTVHVGAKFKYLMSGKRLGQYVIGSPGQASGQHRFPLLSNVETCKVVITSSNPGPLSLIGAGWTGNYFKREQAV